MNFRKNGLVLAVILVAFLFFGCKKSKDSAYYVKFKLDGNWVTWKKNVIGEVGPDFANPGKLDFGVTAENDDFTETFDLTIQISGSAFETKTYTSDVHTIFIMYIREEGGSLKGYMNDNWADQMPEPYFTVTVTSITDQAIKGTFTGNYLATIADEVVTLTEGEFHVRRAR